jgi:hypothetical protein
VGDAGFIHVGDVELRLHGDEEELARGEALVFGEVGCAGGPARVQHGEQLLDGRELSLLRSRG